MGRKIFAPGKDRQIWEKGEEKLFGTGFLQDSGSWGAQTAVGNYIRRRRTWEGGKSGEE